MRGSLADFQNVTSGEVEERDESWFRQQLEQQCSEVAYVGGDFMIVCPFHIDSNPSCHVDKTRGFFHCFACNAKGHWNKLAKTIGAQPLAFIRKDVAVEVSDLKDNISRSLTKAGVKRKKKKKNESEGRPIIKAWPKKDPVRGLSGSMLSALGCIKVSDLVKGVTRIGLPVRDLSGHLLGYTCRALNPIDTKPKYLPLSPDIITYRERDLPVAKALFLIDRAFSKGWKRVVIVEGPFDALFLLSRGIPAISILGTASFTAQKAAILSALGLEKVLVLMDNDPAGRKAKAFICEELYPFAKGIKLPKGIKDPEFMTDKQYEWLYNKLFD